MDWRVKKNKRQKIICIHARSSILSLNENKAIVAINDINSIYLSAWIPDVISGCIETTLQFQDEGLTVQSYYGKSIVKTEEEALRAAQIIIWMNHNLNWDCNTLYEHTYGFVEEDGDLYNYCRIRYELLDDYFDESMNHILNYSVQQLSFVCYPVVAYISGKISYEEAKIMIKTKCTALKFFRG